MIKLHEQLVKMAKKKNKNKNKQNTNVNRQGTVQYIEKTVCLHHISN
jgi:hypothetical protein